MAEHPRRRDEGQGRVRVQSYREYNRTRQEAFAWTPYTLMHFPDGTVADLQAVFARGYIPTPSDDVGVRSDYDALGRLARQRYLSGKTVSLSYYPWGVRQETRYPDSDSREVRHLLDTVGDERGAFALIEQNGDDAADVVITRYERDPAGRLSALWLAEEARPRRMVYDTLSRLEYQVVPGMGDRHYAYDARERPRLELKQGERGEERLIGRAYDSLDRPTRVVADGRLAVRCGYDAYPDGWRPDVPAGYDQPIARPLGQPTELETFDSNGLLDHRERLGYDVNGRSVGVPGSHPRQASPLRGHRLHARGHRVPAPQFPGPWRRATRWGRPCGCSKRQGPGHAGATPFHGTILTDRARLGKAVTRFPAPCLPRVTRVTWQAPQGHRPRGQPDREGTGAIARRDGRPDNTSSQIRCRTGAQGRPDFRLGTGSPSCAAPAPHILAAAGIPLPFDPLRGILTGLGYRGRRPHSRG